MREPRPFPAGRMGGHPADRGTIGLRSLDRANGRLLWTADGDPLPTAAAPPANPENGSRRTGLRLLEMESFASMAGLFMELVQFVKLR